jgi:hypothetical protein
MSVFTGDSSTTGNHQTELTETTDDTHVGYLQQLVEAKGENWRNPEVLAKGKLESDLYISELKAKMSEMEKVLGEQDWSKQLLDQLRDKAASPTGANPGEPNKNNESGATTERNTNAAVSEDQISSLVELSLTKREQLNTQTQNLSLVDKQLEEAYGTEAEAVVVKKAKELGISTDRMKELAAESPSAFFSLIGEPKRAELVRREGSIRTEGVTFASSNERTWAYYRQLRKTNPKLYNSRQSQTAMMADRVRLGTGFY